MHVRSNTVYGIIMSLRLKCGDFTSKIHYLPFFLKKVEGAEIYNATNGKLRIISKMIMTNNNNRLFPFRDAIINYSPNLNRIFIF